jgi:phosphoenolpyruvate-protein phosphotransferase
MADDKKHIILPAIQCGAGSSRGDVISPGIVKGKLVFLGMSAEALFSGDRTGDEPVISREISRFQQQVAFLSQDLQGEIDALESESLFAEADIIRAHILMLKDPEFQSRVHTAIEAGRLSAEKAVKRVGDEFAEVFRSSKNPVFSERANDIRDLANQLQAKLSLSPGNQMPPEVAGSILALPELMSSIVLQARQLGVRAFLVERGTSLSHAAILAKSFGMPVLRVPSIEVLRPRVGTQLLVDAYAGELLFEPAEGEYECRLRQRSAAKKRRGGVARKQLIRLWVSIMDPSQLEDMDWDGIEGVGLYRTETLFMQKTDDFPSEDEQVRIYKKIFELAGNRPVSIRTADIGADKPVSYLSLGPQDNPYLGMRAHRLFRFHPELLITQVRAILRAGYHHPAVRIMYPMIESLDQWRFIHGLVDQAVKSLRKERLPFLDRFEQCILIETPAAVWDFARLLREFDYASIGTNDLVQFLFAVERNNINLKDLYQPEHPVFLRILKALAQEAQRAGKSLALCGEIAGDTNLTGVLVGLGLTDLSVSPGSLEDIRRQLGTMTKAYCLELADACTAAATGEEVRSILGKKLSGAVKLDSRMEAREVDPVCGMVVHTKDNPWTFEDEGVRYYFCSRIHMLRFIDKIGGNFNK